MKRILLLLPIITLAGCATAPKVSVMNGECKTFERPPYAIRGLRQYDQDWIDSTIEGGVGACGWQRPAERPAELDAPAKVTHKTHAKRKLKPWVRFLHFLHHSPKPVVAPEPVAADPVPEPPAPPPPPAPKRPIDELLGVK